MKLKAKLLFLLLFFIVNTLFAQNIHHKLYVELSIENKSIDVIDSIKIADTLLKSGKQIFFTINKNFSVQTLSTDVIIDNVDCNKSDEQKFKVIFMDSTLNVIPIKYKGNISGEIVKSKEYARGFGETKGIISDNGVYLAGSTKWIADFDTNLFTFEIETKINHKWKVVSQGERVVNKIKADKRTVTYNCPYPMEEIYLIGGKWTEYQKRAGGVTAQVFLIKPEQELAEKYLNVTFDYMKSYEKMIGAFPYKKFALIENFWETGYGMPSFTLLGKKVIRFPWILYSSYPHELLHNWWGNSVYVDYEKGNWCEGITVYMADHLMKERKGEGAKYRRETLQKYTNYVNEDNDFPLNEFRSRHSSAQEAVGYGKSMMMFHMLRVEFGDEVFLKVFSDFYENNKFTFASYDDIRKSFEKITGKALKGFFDQWVNRTGAPFLELSTVRVTKPDEYKLSFVLTQTQDASVFDIKIPVAIYDEKGVVLKKIHMTEKMQNFEISCETRPLKIEIDPQFDVFRRLDNKEVPTIISTVLGKESHVIVFPRKSNMYYEYLEFSKSFSKFLKEQGKKVKVINDGNIGDTPKEGTVWILGIENSFAVYNKTLDDMIKLLPEETKKKMKDVEKSGTFVYTYPNPKDESQSFVFVSTTDQYALENIHRKLPHYGKYSFVGYKTKHLKNTLKGVFAVQDSPLSYNLHYKGGTPKISAKLKVKKALCD